jgi:hypothetical protein
MTPEPVFDIAQLAHVELLTPNPEGMFWFVKDMERGIPIESGPGKHGLS